ncbi:MAG: hypothetical protein OER96_08315 [Gammaproteobacteria bacterium]|nr:hypothetical protein [Gammaproteobacteria bacterium]
MSIAPQHAKVIGFLVKRIAQYLYVDIDVQNKRFDGHGLDWDVDGKGVVSQGQGYVVFDCNRRTDFTGQPEKVSCRIAYESTQSSPTANVQAIPLRAQVRDNLHRASGESFDITINPESDPFEIITKLVERLTAMDLYVQATPTLS